MHHRDVSMFVKGILHELTSLNLTTYTTAVDTMLHPEILFTHVAK